MTAVIVGVLFITATVTAILSGVFLGSTLDAPDYLVDVPANETQVVVATLLEFICAAAVIGIGVAMFPVLRRHVESLALGYIGIRLVEAIMLIVGAISLLSLLTLSQEYQAGALEASYYEPSGTSLLALRDWSHVIGTLVFLGLGGWPLYYLLYRSRLVPRWLSGWGLIAATLILVTGVIALFGLSPNSTAVTILAIPIGVQEMVLAVWLIVKGFDSTRGLSESAERGTHAV